MSIYITVSLYALSVMAFNFQDNNCYISSWAYHYDGSPTNPIENLVPPSPIDCATPIKWMALVCPAADMGTLIDWLIFYWQVVYMGLPNEWASVTELADIWKETPVVDLEGNGFVGARWQDLVAQANEKWGSGSAKALHFSTTGSLTGVNY